MKAAGETSLSSRRTSPAAGSYIQPCYQCRILFVYAVRTLGEVEEVLLAMVIYAKFVWIEHLRDSCPLRNGRSVSSFVSLFWLAFTKSLRQFLNRVLFSPKLFSRNCKVAWIGYHNHVTMGTLFLGRLASLGSSPICQMLYCCLVSTKQKFQIINKIHEAVLSFFPLSLIALCRFVAKFHNDC